MFGGDALAGRIDFRRTDEHFVHEQLRKTETDGLCNRFRNDALAFKIPVDEIREFAFAYFGVDVLDADVTDQLLRFGISEVKIITLIMFLFIDGLRQKRNCFFERLTIGNGHGKRLADVTFVFVNQPMEFFGENFGYRLYVPVFEFHLIVMDVRVRDRGKHRVQPIARRWRAQCDQLWGSRRHAQLLFVVFFHRIDKRLGVVDRNVGQNAVAEVHDVAVFAEFVDHLVYHFLDRRDWG